MDATPRLGSPGASPPVPECGHVGTRPAYDYPLDDPRHRCVQGLCDDHAGPGSVEADLLRRLERFFLPLSPEEAADRLRANTGSGVLTRNMIIRALGGEPTEGS